MGIDSLLGAFSKGKSQRKDEIISFNDYLELCKKDKMTYATPAQRLREAIGDPKYLDTSKASDPRLSRIHDNKTIAQYDAFDDFFGMENTIEEILSHIEEAAQGLENERQVLYLLGPVGSAKSSLAERLMSLMEEMPIYTFQGADIDGLEGQISPINEHPLGMFADNKEAQKVIEEEYKIDPRYIPNVPSKWLLKRLEELKRLKDAGEIDSVFDGLKIVKRYPSRANQVAIARTEPGDENNQDVSTLIGKVDIRKLEDYSQTDPDAYDYQAAALGLANQGMLEFVEMFKAPIKVLNPLLAATQEGQYAGNEQVGQIPFSGMIIAHSNESEWEKFRNDPKNEAFIDRVNIIKAPYNLRIDEEIKIYEKMLAASELKDAPCAPYTLRMLATLAVMSRLEEHENSDVYTKARVYNGEYLKDSNPNAKSLQEYKDSATLNEGMSGLSTRFMFKAMAATFNYHAGGKKEIAADPVHLMYILEQRIKKAQLPKETEKQYLGYLKELSKEYAENVLNEIKAAFLENHDEYGQHMFDRYISFADAWIEDQDYKDPDTGQLMDRETLDAELSKIERPASIGNPKDFRNEVVKFALRARANNGGKNPDWKSYEKLRTVIEKRVSSNMADMIPIISFGNKKDKDTQKKHQGYVERMEERGYTQTQIRRITEWAMRAHQSLG